MSFEKKNKTQKKKNNVCVCFLFKEFQTVCHSFSKYDEFAVIFAKIIFISHAILRNLSSLTIGHEKVSNSAQGLTKRWSNKIINSKHVAKQIYFRKMASAVACLLWHKTEEKKVEKRNQINIFLV